MIRNNANRYILGQIREYIASGTTYRPKMTQFIGKVFQIACQTNDHHLIRCIFKTEIFRTIELSDQFIISLGNIALKNRSTDAFWVIEQEFIDNDTFYLRMAHWILTACEYGHNGLAIGLLREACSNRTFESAESLIAAVRKLEPEDTPRYLSALRAMHEELILHSNENTASMLASLIYGRLVRSVESFRCLHEVGFPLREVVNFRNYYTKHPSPFVTEIFRTFEDDCISLYGEGLTGVDFNMNVHLWINYLDRRNRICCNNDDEYYVCNGLNARQYVPAHLVQRRKRVYRFVCTAMMVGEIADASGNVSRIVVSYVGW
jgi:hypothetical protein